MTSEENAQPTEHSTQYSKRSPESTARIGRSLERAIIVFYELRKRALASDDGETNPILDSDVWHPFGTTD